MIALAVVLAGGGGTRFWPLSRQNKPKQLLSISGRDAMINDTISRYNTVISEKDTYIVTNESQAELLDDILLNSVPRNNIIKEPFGKNTAACILYASLKVQKKFGNVIMAVLPSDHYVANVSEYQKKLTEAIGLAEKYDKLVTIGIKPTFISTGYGYINYNNVKSVDSNIEAYDIIEFVEKPNFEKAKNYVESGKYLWNSGMFIWQSEVIIDNFKRYLPRLYNSFSSIYEYIDTPEEGKYVADLYDNIQSISIDYGILERSDEVIVLPGDFGWSDVGSWDCLGSIFPPDAEGNIVKAKHVGIETNGSIIYSENRLIATIGIKDLIIVDSDDAVLVCPKEKAQMVRNIVDSLKLSNNEDFI